MSSAQLGEYDGLIASHCEDPETENGSVSCSLKKKKEKLHFLSPASDLWLFSQLKKKSRWEGVQDK